MGEKAIEHEPRLHGLLSQIVRQFDPVAVHLFGSRAKGTADRDSDYDLLIVVDDDAPRERVSVHRAYQAIDTRDAPADLLLIREAAFNRDRSEVGTISYTAFREGRLVHEGWDRSTLAAARVARSGRDHG